MCQPAFAGDAGGFGGLAALLAALALAGLAGGLMHCAPMCGVFVLAQVDARLTRVPVAAMSEATRLRAGLLPGYHLGRIATYAALGAVAGLIGQGFGDSLAAVDRLRGWAAVPLGLAGLVLLASAGMRLGLLGQPNRPALFPAGGTPGSGGQGSGGQGSSGQGSSGPGSSGPARAPGVAGFASRLLTRIRPWLAGGGCRGVGTGLVLGFLPCGLVYAALAAALAAGRPLAGALAMVAFGLGTIPALGVVGVGGQALLRRHPALARKLAPALLGLAALPLIAGAATLVVG
ncbi:hypothetical protein GCM10011505_30390 [Tistrella bauzanensis]|uniref:Urease accessory protein UreH-like transmembrane domain-containing protein n=1 Tax=Tistrella bauzanensis TaxID=657419 RepID=A0ABQ1IRD7_9PROT|nr:hypothetical protein GCM10011505_30390 [Tistrella bauzanensis]